MAGTPPPLIPSLRPGREELAKLPAIAAYLEQQYNLRARHPEREAIYADYVSRSQRMRNSVEWQCLRYAGPDRCTIDWFPSPGRNAESPLLVFFHGGFWRAGDKRVFSFLAEPYLAVGISVALMGYELAPSVTITTIGEQAAEGVAWLMTQARDLRFGAHRVTLSGHSAGGHLSALLSTLPPSRFGAPFNGVLPISGIFNLAPMLLTSINHEARITAPETISESPALRGAFYGKRYFLVAGGEETEGFVDQTTDFADLLKAQGFECSMTLATGRTHFDIFEEFVSNDSAVYRQTLSVILG